MYLLDTDTVIYLLKGHASVMENVRRHEADPMKISVITLMELYHGAHRSQRVAANVAKVRALEARIEVVPLAKDGAEIFGMQKAELERSGTPLDDFDLAIAACALSWNLTLVTNNIKHFRRIEGLKIENWARLESAL